ncbi:MAG: hypothetical protein ABI854_13110 [Betaproteobacteria bacterium]
MNTDTRALRNAVNDSIDTDRWQSNAESYKDRMLSELKTLIGDAQDLLGQASESTSEGFASVRSQFDRQLGKTRAQLDRATKIVNRNARRSTAAARGYVQENPLQSVGVATAAGVIAGLLIYTFVKNR